jgi:hypothetical protein
MSDYPVEIRTLPEGESGVVQGKLSHDTLESMASWWSLPDGMRVRWGAKDPYDVAILAKRLGVTPGFVRKQQRNPRVLAAIKRRINEAVVLMMPNVIQSQYELAVVGRDPRAAKFLAEIAGFLRQSGGVGVTVQQNVGVNVQVHNAKDGGIQEDAEVKAAILNMRSSGLLDRILNSEITDVEPIEP